MKKLIIKITAVAIFSFISFTALAQNTAEKKPKIADVGKTTEQDKTAAAATAPQIVATPKAMHVAEQPKPIVPGGEFKPMDTDKPVKNYAKTPAPEKTSAPAKIFEQQTDQKISATQPVLLKEQ